MEEVNIKACKSIGIFNHYTNNYKLQATNEVVSVIIILYVEDDFVVYVICYSTKMQNGFFRATFTLAFCHVC